LKDGVTVRKFFRVLLCTLAGVGAGAKWAGADTLIVGGPATFTYNISLTGYGSESGGAGNFQNVTLNGKTLPFMYCVDITHNINYSTYTNTSVNTQAYISDADLSKGYQVYAMTDGYGHLTNAGAIEWLIANVAPGVTGNQDATMGLQLAIWQLEYGKNFSFTGATPGEIAAYTKDLSAQYGVGYNSTTQLAAMDSYSNSNVLWINPVDSGGNFAQAQISLAPLPGTLTMTSIFLGMIGVVGAGRARKKRAVVAA
jgi:hypothetical protein